MARDDPKAVWAGKARHQIRIFDRQFWSELLKCDWMTDLSAGATKYYPHPPSS